MQLRRKLIAVSVAGLAVAGAGGAVAASKLDSPKEENQAVLNDAADQLDVQPSELSDALKKALSNRIDEAVRDGRLTKAEGEELKERINSGDFPLFGLPGGPFGGPRFDKHPFGLIEPDPMGELSTAADYLGLTVVQLRDQLNDGKTLAQIAKARDKSVDGLVDKLVDRQKDRIEEAVKDGKLSRDEADQILAKVRQAVTDFVNHGRLHFEFRGGGRPDLDIHPGGPRFGPRDGSLLPAA